MQMGRWAYGWLGWAETFDPYPYISFNLALPRIAAVQSLLIVMSQHRQDDTVRLRTKSDCGIKLKAERESRQVHGKSDDPLLWQWVRLSEMPQRKMDILEVLGRDQDR
ncbi:DUF1003 domain-containing protein [Pseudoruegeria sp. SK021]|uniref:DUF1003 domain-containing protein n=1 Tax=Pseudoruegeria sp. SK021 TaxID=1933035 RepID=UPI000A2397B7|nr:DUF1003 domain-containing protein [Pseudoruegeria sp. SK021]OSP56398.1 hypothetical protein BV911_00020 [Pseudoruegeria sp. SK021]